MLSFLLCSRTTILSPIAPQDKHFDFLDKFPRLLLELKDKLEENNTANVSKAEDLVRALRKEYEALLGKVEGNKGGTPDSSGKAAWTPDSTDKAVWSDRLITFERDVKRMTKEKGVMASALGALGLQQAESANQNKSMSSLLASSFSAAISAATSK
jgi:hypothetical protein